MPREPLVLFPADATAGEAWRVGRVVDASPRVTPLPVAADATPAAVAAAVAAVAAGPVTLALPSSACLAASVETDGRFRGGWRTYLAYQLELALPLAAEDVAADFLPHPRQRTALGVAVAVAAVRPLLDALESAGLTVAAVCPAGLLAVDAERPDGGDGLVVWGHGTAVDLFEFAAGQVTAWYTLPAEADDVRPYLAAVTAAGPVRLVNVPADVAALFEGERRDTDWSTAATAAAVAGRRPIDLARGDLAPRGRAAAARRSLVHAAVAAVALAGVGCGALLWRASAYGRLADGQVEQQRQIFRHLFPGRPVPPDVRSRLGSEARGLSTPSADGPGADVPGLPAVAVLHGLLAALPADVRFRLARVEVAAGRVEVEGTVPTRSDADALAAAVRDGTGLAVDTPQTQQDGPRAVHFTLVGSAAGGGAGGGP